MPDNPDDPRPIQLHLVLPYKFDPIDHRQVRELLGRGYRIGEFHRLTDREVVVTLVPAEG